MDIIHLDHRDEEKLRARELVAQIGAQLIDEVATDLERCFIIALALADGGDIQVVPAPDSRPRFTVKVQVGAMPEHAKHALGPIIPQSARDLLRMLRARAATVIATERLHMEWVARVQQALDETAASDAELEELQERAGQWQEFGVVHLCERAMNGDLMARRACGYIIATWCGGRP